MPDMWPAIARQGYECAYGTCEREGWIEKGTDCVQSRIERKVYSWHPTCWLVDAFRRLRESPRQLVTPGRRPLDLSPEDRQERDKLIRNYAAYKGRIGEYQGRVDNIPDGIRVGRQDELKTRIAKITLQQDVIWFTMLKLGGVPPKWRIPASAKDDSGSVKDMFQEPYPGAFLDSASTDRQPVLS